MNSKRTYTSILAVYIAVTVAVCTIYSWNLEAEHEEELLRHCEVIARDVWDYDPQGPVEYLSLAARLNHYELVTVLDDSDSRLLEIDGGQPGGLGQFLAQLGLIRLTKLESEITYRGEVIGTLSLVHRSHAIYSYAYIFVVTSLLCAVTMTWAKTHITNRMLMEARENLELRVKQRTIELENEVTDRRQVEQALRLSENQYAETISSIDDIIWRYEVDKNGKQTGGYIAPVADRFLGLKEGEVDHSFERYFNHVVPEDLPVVEEAMASALAAVGERKSVEYRLQKADGSLLSVLSRGVARSQANGNVILFGVTTDITETKRLQMLESRAERLETAGTIAGQVAHDFNNLLAPLMAYPEIIREELPQGSSVIEYVNVIENAAGKIADINQELLAMGRRGHYNQKNLNLNQIVQHALSELKPYPETMTCKTDLCENLMDVRGGAGQLHRVVSNLLHNAKDAIQDIGQIAVKTENYYVDDLTIKFGRVPKGEYVKLSVSDTGCGMPDDVAQKIFDPFFSTKSADTKRGSGLGMSVVDAVIKDHRGFIDLSTKLGEGTSFYVFLPISRESVVNSDAEAIEGGSESILIVDDDDIQREVTSELLRGLGYEVYTVESGEEAVEFIRGQQVDFVILDMIMPGGIDGTETYRRINEFNPNQKAVISSGFAESDRVFEAQRLGVGAFVKKPLTKRILATAVRRELEKDVVTVSS